MPTRQSKSIARIRAARRKAGLCFECGARSKTYRCASCNAKRQASEKEWRKKYMLKYMRERRRKSK